MQIHTKNFSLLNVIVTNVLVCQQLTAILLTEKLIMKQVQHDLNKST